MASVIFEFNVYGKTLKELDDDAARVLLAAVDDPERGVDYTLAVEPHVSASDGTIQRWLGHVRAEVE